MVSSHRSEAYKGFHIEPEVVFLRDTCCTDEIRKWQVPNVVIRRAGLTEPVKTLKPKAFYATTKDEAYHQAVKLGKEEIDRLRPAR